MNTPSHFPVRHFLGWDRPIIEAAGERLFEHATGRPLDLGNLLVLVPTQQAGRRLRGALALHAAQRGTALLPPLVRTPPYFVRCDDFAQEAAPPLVEMLAWISTLSNTPDATLRPLLPHGTQQAAMKGLAAMATALAGLRRELGDVGMSMCSVLDSPFLPDHERPRWHCLATLEQQWLQRLHDAGWIDAVELETHRATHPVLPPEITRVIVVGVPDPTPLLERTLVALPRSVAVEIWIHAPSELHDAFDAWGRPNTEHWLRRPLPLDWSNGQVLVAGTPRDQAHEVHRTLTTVFAQAAFDDVAIGAPDDAVAEALSHLLENERVPFRRPTGRSVNQHPLGRALAVLSEAWLRRDFPSLRALLRHRDVLASCCHRAGCSPHRLLAQLDRLWSLHLPLNWRDIQHFANTDQAHELRAVLDIVRGDFEHLDREGFVLGCMDVLAVWYEGRTLQGGVPADEEFLSVVRAIEDEVTAFTGIDWAHWGDFTHEESVAFFFRMLDRATVFSEPTPGGIEIEGWLELHWNDAPAMMITGLNEGKVPSGLAPDPFLPDSLRRLCGLRTDASRCARDAYLLHAIIASRQQGTGVRLFCGRHGEGGEALTPSRLLLLCDDAELPSRVRTLFHEPPTPPGRPAPEFSFQVTPPAPPPGVPEHFSPSSIGSYLRCPFTFYLEQVLGTRVVDDLAMEMNPLQFGSLTHECLRILAEPDIVDQTDPEKIIPRLNQELERLFTRDFAMDGPATLLVQRDALRRRLAAAAHLHTHAVTGGWRVTHVEHPFEFSLAGERIRGRIDRIERHTESGRFRVLDYKTSDVATEPAKTHWASWKEGMAPYQCVSLADKTFAWIQLQLPLYVHALGITEGIPSDKIDAGLIMLTAAITDSRVELLTPLDAAVLDSALACATGVIADVRKGIFWPPSEPSYSLRNDTPHDRLIGGPLRAAISPLHLQGIPPP